MLICFEGPDAGGKDAIHEAFERLTNYQHTTVVRFFLSKWVYSLHFDRGDRKFWRELGREARLFQAAFDPVTVYCTADDRVLKSRIALRGEKPGPDPDKIKALYEEALQQFVPSHMVIRVDTTGDPDPKEMAWYVVRELKKIAKSLS